MGNDLQQFRPAFLKIQEDMERLNRAINPSYLNIQEQLQRALEPVRRQHEMLAQSMALSRCASERLAEIVQANQRWQDIVVQAVDGVDLQIMPGETLGLVGESGCGKTTLGRVLVRLYEPTEGQILFRGGVGQDVILPYNAPDFHRMAQIIFQNPYSSLNPRKTVRDIVSVPLRKRGLTDPLERDEEVMRLLERVGLSLTASKFYLSGQLQYSRLIVLKSHEIC